ncbi:MarR family transcriptional regulator [Marinobacter hydrocarbonoclasticus]|jgi:DNA-binding MarR family transcriptional regulator|uniref:MarR family winged helix-turn-helix transcriptional regulator n=1 Tax=Marinobacter TaxID=2742 RepID=UPI001A8CAFBC|nr:MULTISPECIES: MarR family transcriptional regulator [Marinobacter]MBN8237960.1 MarR family transcriptional regulator [Marinobacter nauticus]
MTDNDQILALDNQICFALYAANRAVTARYRPILEELGLTYPQYLVMLVMWEADREGIKPRVSDLGARLRLDSGTLTPLLKRLEQRDLLQRARLAEDERVVRLRLTNAGRALRAKAANVPGRLICGLDIDPERLLSLRQELRSLLEILEAVEPSER